ncbi:MAG TPA: proton-conducting transporter membrane subunit [Anaeromyxobacteraceae bacterium]|nr:proton-conducting transporter membrane subunit [Anaeromyxobacteraceae bacterium]
MTLLAWALLLLGAGASLALAASARPRVALLAGSAAAVVASALGLAAAVRALDGGAPEVLRLGHLPPAELHLRLDPLSAFFLAALFALALPASIYGVAYMRPFLGRRSLGLFVCAFDLLLASIAVVLTARDAVLFLVAWELMTVSSFVLVAFEHERADVRRASLVYLVASHLGAAFLFAFFVLLGRNAGSFDLDAIEAARASIAAPGALFAFAAVGFGTKAGLVPLHVWLPEAHPAAPSHVSALLSGVMIKTGVYGLLRAASFLPPAPASWGVAIATIGASGAVVAIVLALGQRDLKRALAYSSVENVGVVALGLGLGMAATARGAGAVALLGFAGALLHVWNHALMKGLAFMGAGALAHASHTRDLERMGGLLRRLPATGALFLVAACALAALPPLNGFASEWLVYMGLLRASTAGTGAGSLVALLAFAILALTGAITAIAMSRLAGTALLGAPRSAAAAAAHEPGPAIWAPLALLAAACLALGLFPDAALRLAAPALAQIAGLAPSTGALEVAALGSALAIPVRVAAGCLAALAAAAVLAGARLRGARPLAASETWGCGFAHPTARMQYTAASYAQLFTSLAPDALRPRARVAPPKGPFPAAGSLETDADDPARARLFDPVFARLADRFARLRRFQADRLNLQLFYTMLTVLALGAALWLRGLP